MVGHARGGPGNRPSAPQERAIDLLAEVFSSRIRACVLAYMAPRLDSGFSLTELSRALDLPVSSLQHECYKLERLGVMIGRREGVSRRYRLARGHDLTVSLVRLVVAVIGLDAALSAATADLSGLEALVLAGDGSAGQVRLVLIGELSLEAIQTVHEHVAGLLGISPDGIELAFFRLEEWRTHQANDHQVIHRLLDRPVLGTAGDASWFTANNPAG